jgi:integrase
MAKLRQVGKLGSPGDTRLKFDDIASDLVRDYEINNLRSLSYLRAKIKILGEHFGRVRIERIDSSAIRSFTLSRKRVGAANATINRELAALRRMFTLARESGREIAVPHFQMLKEDNARQGFLEHCEFLKLQEHLPDYLRDFIAFLYYSGWRAGEARALEWRDVDLDHGVVLVRPEVSKTKQGRTLPLGAETSEIIGRAVRARRPSCPFVFHRGDLQIQKGTYRNAWTTACADAGLGERFLVHDLRRTAARNLVRAGVHETVAMKLTGHKTRSVFDRYNIASDADVRRATELLSIHLAGRSATAAEGDQVDAEMCGKCVGTGETEGNGRPTEVSAESQSPRNPVHSVCAFSALSECLGPTVD